jgi:hypothetical protein
MKIPEKAEERAEFVADVIQRCTASQEDRREAYRTLKQFYLYGLANRQTSSTVR